MPHIMQGACKAAEDCLEIKGRDEYVLENQRQVRDVHDDYYERYDYVNKAHDRNENAGYIGKALAAAEDGIANRTASIAPIMIGVLLGS